MHEVRNSVMKYNDAESPILRRARYSYFLNIFYTEYFTQALYPTVWSFNDYVYTDTYSVTNGYSTKEIVQS